MPKKPYKSTKARVLPIEWNIPDDIITRYATNMVVQRMEKEFKISFFELKRPVILEENKQEWDKVKSLRADCVSSVIVTVDRLPKFIEVLQEQLNRYTSSDKTE